MNRLFFILTFFTFTNLFGCEQCDQQLELLHKTADELCVRECKKLENTQQMKEMMQYGDGVKTGLTIAFKYVREKCEANNERH